MSSPPPRTKIPALSELSLELETPRLTLRPVRATDVDDLWPYVSDPAFPKQMSWAAHTQKSETLEYLQSVEKSLADNTGADWAIVHGGKVIGKISLDSIRWEFRAWRIDRAELGYWLAPELWGKGLMTEAAHRVLVFAFDELGLHKITVGCFDDNKRSRRVIEKLGFRHVGTLEDDVWRDGAWHTHLRYELTAARWSDVTTTMPISRPHPT
ncbi:MAG: GNAT family N-acetyltransferase [Deltaproteobacteria bacterium]|nr:GNAT family N-acetyltransferase [Deltaproteobacteria bacterium]